MQPRHQFLQFFLNCGDKKDYKKQPGRHLLDQSQQQEHQNNV